MDAVPALASTCTSDGRLNLARSLDSDDDELPDWWELDYAVDLDTMDSESDLDGDMVSDLGEYRTETDPTQATDQWTVSQQIPTGSGNNIQLRWQSHAGCSYRVRVTDNLLSNPFQVASDLLPATPPTNEWSSVISNSTLFYKTELLWQ